MGDKERVVAIGGSEVGGHPGAVRDWDLREDTRGCCSGAGSIGVGWVNVVTMFLGTKKGLQEFE